MFLLMIILFIRHLRISLSKSFNGGTPPAIVITDIAGNVARASHKFQGEVLNMIASSSIQPERKASLIKTLVRALGKRVLVVLKGQMEVNGILRGFDEHMNLHVDNAVTTDGLTMEIETLGTIILRGDSVLLVNADDLVKQQEK